MFFCGWLTDEEGSGAGVVELVEVVDSGGSCGDGGVRRAGLLRRSHMLALLVYRQKKKAITAEEDSAACRGRGDLQRRGD